MKTETISELRKTIALKDKELEVLRYHLYKMRNKAFTMFYATEGVLDEAFEARMRKEEKRGKD